MAGPSGPLWRWERAVMRCVPSGPGAATRQPPHRCRPARSHACSMQDKSAGIMVSISREKRDAEAPGALFLPLPSLPQSFISTIFICSSFIIGTIPLNSLATYPSFVLALRHWPLLIMLSVSGLSMVLFTWRITMTNKFFLDEIFRWTADNRQWSLRILMFFGKKCKNKKWNVL